MYIIHVDVRNKFRYGMVNNVNFVHKDYIILLVYNHV